MASEANDEREDDPERPEHPRSLGRYEVLCEIASGGMARVYLARSTGAAGFERFVAIKCCHPHLRHEAEFTAMFLDEARIAARIRHPNVVATTDVSAEREALYLVMDYIDGFSLWDLIRAAHVKRTSIPAGIAIRVIIDALNGLHAAHELTDAQGDALHIIHRDVSPQNVIVGLDGVSRITDFGIAKAEHRLHVTRDGTVKGKLSYMAPEQHGLDPSVAGEALTRRGDLFAAAVVLWEAVAGARLFSGETDAETFQKIRKIEVPRLAGSIAGVTPKLDAVLERAMSRQPSARYATAAEFADALEMCGIAIARPRVVASYVRMLMSHEISHRKALLKKFDAADHSPAPRSDSLRRKRGARQTAPADAETARPPRRARTRLRRAIAVAVILAITLGLSYAGPFVRQSPRFVAFVRAIGSIASAMAPTASSSMRSVSERRSPAEFDSLLPIADRAEAPAEQPSVSVEETPRARRARSRANRTARDRESRETSSRP